MNRDLVERIARAVLYEGYILYPYRPSVKNRQRWSFGGLYPKAWSVAQDGTDPSAMQTQCLLRGDEDAAVRISVRFLHLIDRTVNEIGIAEDETSLRTMNSLSVNGKTYQPWQEAAEREADLGEITISSLLSSPILRSFTFPENRAIELLRDDHGIARGALVRAQKKIDFNIEVSATRISDKLIQLTVRIENTTPFDSSDPSRDSALMASLVSTHTILGARNAQFISLTDPPDECRSPAAACKNIGAWPILVGDEATRDTLLSSPIILSDFPQIAPESPGDLFDATEIDEILTLRIMTLTDDEKRQAEAIDPLAKEMMARTEALAREQLMGLHGTMRGLRPIPHPFDSIDPPRPKLQRVRVGNLELQTGDRVRLRPLGRADIFDIALDGKTATIASIEQDFEDRIQLAVTVDDDPGKDLGLTGQPGHRFFFGVEEVEPISQTHV